MFQVIIPTCGLGLRLGELTKNYNKALLPYGSKPIISHIIDNFSQDIEFIIPIGHCKNLVVDFLQVAYPNHNFTFVIIDDYTSTDSGPGYTVQQCKPYINKPFYYIPCDTYFVESLVDNVDTVYYKTVPNKLQNQYTMLYIKNNKVIDYTFKTSNYKSDKAFTGLMYIQNYTDFFERLNHKEIIFTIQENTKCKELSSWIDFGQLEIYNTENTKLQPFNFTKTNEYTYHCNGKIIKYNENDKVSEKKFYKFAYNPNVFPNNVCYKQKFLAYDYYPGNVVYHHKNLNFISLLEWLDEKVWLKSNTNITNDCILFYRDKTFSRIESFFKKYPDLKDVNRVNNIEVKSWDYYLDKIDWNTLYTDTVPGFVHGDLQFDNILVNSNSYKLIDWRHEFGNNQQIGDIYYDLAKLLGGLYIDYSQIKDNEFNFVIQDETVSLHVPTMLHHQFYMTQLKNYILSKGYNWIKVQTLVPIIYWNMAPLHHYPFDLLLWYYGIKLFAEVYNDEKIL